MVFVPTPAPSIDMDLAAQRCGAQRRSMRTNALIHRAGLGEVNKVTFCNPAPDHVFGVPKVADLEGARDVTMYWAEHKRDASDRPGPDFRLMNKLAATHGITDASKQASFRARHYKTLIRGDAVKTPPPGLPSDRDLAFTYGLPNTYRSAEQTRNAGPFDPPMKKLVQAQYQDMWTLMNANRDRHGRRTGPRAVPPINVATQGHAAGAQARIARHAGHATTVEPFKLKRFKKVPAKVTLHIKGGAPAAPHHDLVDNPPCPATEGNVAAIDRLSVGSETAEERSASIAKSAQHD